MTSYAQHPFQVVQSEKLSDQISRQLLETIVAGHYQPGDLLPPERDLATIFQVSRPAVREALGSLVARGILSVRQGRGTTVNPVDEWNTLDPEVLLLLNGDVIFEKLTEMRRIIEPEIAALAAAKGTEEEIEALRPLSDLPDSDTMEEHVERDSEFHLLIAKMARNPVLLVMLSSTSELLQESRRHTFLVPGELPKARAWHHRIFAAIEAGEPDTARDSMRAHLEQVGLALQRYEQIRGDL